MHGMLLNVRAYYYYCSYIGIRGREQKQNATGNRMHGMSLHVFFALFQVVRLRTGNKNPHAISNLYELLSLFAAMVLIYMK